MTGVVLRTTGASADRVRRGSCHNGKDSLRRIYAYASETSISVPVVPSVVFGSLSLLEGSGAGSSVRRSPWLWPSLACGQGGLLTLSSAVRSVPGFGPDFGGHGGSPHGQAQGGYGAFLEGGAMAGRMFVVSFSADGFGVLIYSGFFISCLPCSRIGPGWLRPPPDVLLPLVQSPPRFVSKHRRSHPLSITRL